MTMYKPIGKVKSIKLKKNSCCENDNGNGCKCVTTQKKEKRKKSHKHHLSLAYMAWTLIAKI